MAVKIDKELLIKHHFWILSGCLLIVAVIPIVLLSSGVGGAVENAEKALKGVTDSVKGISSQPKNEKWVQAYKEVDKVVDAKKVKVWEACFQRQQDMMTWPVSAEVNFADKYKYMGDEISIYDAQAYTTVYGEQIPELVWLVDPVTPEGKGVVQFNGGWKTVLDLDPNRKWEYTPPSKEDIWLAQEDIWLKRELLRIVRDANDSVARLTEAKPDTPAKSEPKAAAAAGKDGKSTGKAKAAPEKTSKIIKPHAVAGAGDRFHKVFRNAYWEIELYLAQNKQGKFTVRGSLKNVGNRRQAVPNFKVLLDDQGAQPAGLQIDGEPLAVGQQMAIPEFEIPDALTVKGLFGVEQILTWRSGAVKRIDEIRMNHNSSRTSHKTLRQPLWIKSDATTEATPAPAQTTGTGDTTSLSKNPMMAMGGGAAGSTEGLTKNGFVLARYLDANDQVRHIPVGMVVVVEEQHIPTFLGAFANSKLRIQTQQFHWHHIKDKIRPETKDSSGSGAAAAGTRPGQQLGGGGEALPTLRGGPALGGGGGYGASQGGTMQMMRRMGAGTGTRPGGGGATGPGFGQLPGLGAAGLPAPVDEDEAELNLVELSVYGVASLYERPGKPKTDQLASTDANK